MDTGSLQFPKINFQNENTFVVLHQIYTPKDLVVMRNIDEDGIFLASSFLLNLPLLIKCQHYYEVIDNFNDRIREILKQKYIGRNVNVNFDTYKEGCPIFCIMYPSKFVTWQLFLSCKDVKFVLDATNLTVSPQTNRIRYQKTVFGIQLKT